MLYKVDKYFFKLIELFKKNLKLASFKDLLLNLEELTLCQY